VYGELSLNPKKGITCGNIENLGQEAIEKNKFSMYLNKFAKKKKSLVD